MYFQMQTLAYSSTSAPFRRLGNAQGRDSGMHVSIRLISAEVRAGSSCLQINHIDRLSHSLRMGTG